MTDNGVQAISVRDTQDPEEVVNKINEGMASGLEPDIALIFSSPDIDVEGLNEELDEKLGFDYAGVTTAGEITPEGSHRGTVAALIIDRNDIDFSISVEKDVHDDPEDKGRRLAEDCIESLSEHDNKGMFLLTPGITQTRQNVEFAVLKGVTSVVSSDMPISGGSAGDNANLRRTYQFSNGELMKDGAIAVGISTDHGIRSVQEHGKDEVVATGIVTESDGREIVSIGDQSAAEFYADATGIEISELKSLYDLPFKQKLEEGMLFLKNLLLGKNPILVGQIFDYSLDNAIAEELGPGEEIITQPIYITRRNGITTSKKIEENQVVKILKGDRESIISAGKDAADRSESPLFGIFADCATRRLILEEDELGEEIRQIAQVMGEDFVGWYAMGEIGQDDGMICTFMNQTVSGLVVEKKH